MEENNKSLITVNSSLAKIEKQIAIGEKILGLRINNTEKEKIKEFLITILKIKGYETFMRYLLEYFPISRKIIDKYEKKIFWGNLSCNEKVKFTPDLLEYPQWWAQVYNLKRNKSVNWDLDLIKRFDNYEGRNNVYDEFSDFFWSNELIELYGNRLNWDSFSSNENFPWSENFIYRYSSKLNWEILSQNKSIPWSEDFIYKYSSKFDWENLSLNESIPWTEDFVEKYKYKLNWKYLSCNPNLPWIGDFIDKYMNDWNWKNLSENEGLPWSKEFFLKYKNHLDLHQMSRNKGIKWDEDFFSEFLTHKRVVWGWLSYCSLPWSLDLILKYQDKWDWDSLTRNESIVWTDEMINSFSDKINWKIICQNKTFKLDLDFFLNNLKKYDKDGAFFIRIVQLTEPYLDDKLIDDLISEALGTLNFNTYPYPASYDE